MNIQLSLAPIISLIAGALGYVLTMLYWRWWVRSSWKKRQARRREKLAG